jgi:hypothetical protein
VDGLRWHFWIISDEYNKEVAARIKNGPDPQRRLIQKGERVSVGAMAWGEISEENNARLQFVKEKLEHRVDDGQTLAYLQERHREFLEGVLIEGDDDDPATSEKEPVAVDAGNAWTPLRLNRRFPRFPSNCLTLRSSRSPSCRRSIDRHFNFVPHRFARRQVEVRLTASTFEIFLKVIGLPRICTRRPTTTVEHALALPSPTEAEAR